MKSFVAVLGFSILFLALPIHAQDKLPRGENKIRERISINDNWRFFKYQSIQEADKLEYDVRPEVAGVRENKVADARPTEAVKIESTQKVLKPWILASGNAFIKDPQFRHARPEGNPGSDFPFVQTNFADNSWEKINLPHD